MTPADIALAMILQDGICWSCGAGISGRPYVATYATPIDRGGRATLDNLRLICVLCTDDDEAQPGEWE